MINDLAGRVLEQWLIENSVLIRNSSMQLWQTRSLHLWHVQCSCVSVFIRIRQHNIMRCILEQDYFRLLIVDLGRRKLKKRHVLKRTVCRLLIDVLERPRRRKRQVLKKNRIRLANPRLDQNAVKRSRNKINVPRSQSSVSRWPTSGGSLTSAFVLLIRHL